ncbi:RDD family protein [Chitinibacter sp. S2-10]|uniref:RDD family protein n=1 Tax=Chitinibacter sp. S2-10 TaxID=3373597 RepID=UPI003977C554
MSNTETAVEKHLGNATLGRRLLALPYEILLLVALLLIAGGLFQGMVQLLTGIAPEQLSSLLWARILNGVWLLLVAFAYFGWSWTRGQTLAMLTWRMRIAPLAGELSWRTAAIRFAVASAFYVPLTPLWVLALHQPHIKVWAWFGTVWFCVPWLYVWFDADKQLLHDRIAGTRIVNSPKKK